MYSKHLDPETTCQKVIVRIPDTQGCPLSFAQERIWFLDQLTGPVYNIPHALQMWGVLNIPALTKALEAVVGRHQTLRTIFPSPDGRPKQLVLTHVATPWILIDMSVLPRTLRDAEMRRVAVTEAEQPFNLAQGPLLRARLLRLETEHHVALFTIHHIIADGWSMEILVRELIHHYTGFLQGQPSTLPELPMQYADFAVWQDRKSVV